MNHEKKYALFFEMISVLRPSAQNHRLAGKKTRFPIHGTLDNQDKCLCLWRLLSCPVTGVILWLVKAGREKKRAHFFMCHLAFRTNLFCLRNYSPVRSLASLGLERFCDKVPQFRKKTRAFFLATLGILAESSLSLWLLSCQVTCVTEASVF